jgi:hypothetical protein
MTVHRINGCPLNLQVIDVEELFRLVEMIGQNQDQLERELRLVNNETLRRALEARAN